MTRFARDRRGVTLIELLVVMAVLTALAGLALVVVPGITQKDQTLKGTSDVQTAMKVAQGLAAAAKQPRGVRLIAPLSGSYVTELQYLEVPPVLLPDTQPLVGATFTTGRPQVVIRYTLDGSGNVTNRQCFLFNLTPDQAAQVGFGTTLTLPTLNFFSRIQTPLVGPGSLGNSEVRLEVYPDAALGGATSWVTFHFGIYGAPRPLLGEPTVQLPLNICVDLSLVTPRALPSAFAGNGGGGGGSFLDYDIVFAPSGQLLPSFSRLGGGQIFLWVRDYTKVPTMQIVAGPPNWQMVPQQFRSGGEQQIVGIRGASIGTAPVMWPDDMGTGAYAPPNSPYKFAQDKLTGSGQ